MGSNWLAPLISQPPSALVAESFTPPTPPPTHPPTDSLCKDLAKAERLASRHKMAAISGGNSYGLEVAPLVGGHKSASSRSKYEAAFPAKEGGSSFGNPAKDAVYPYMSDPYEAAKAS